MDAAQIRRHIMQGDTAKALTELEQATRGTGWNDKIALLSARYQKMRDRERMQTADSDDLAVEQNRINQALLEILHNVEHHDFAAGSGRVARARAFSQVSIGMWAAAFVVILGLGYLLTQVFSGGDDATDQDPNTISLSQEDPNATETADLTTETTPPAADKNARYEQYYIGKTDGNQQTPSEIRYLELTDTESRVIFNYQNDYSRPIELQGAFLTNRDETDCPRTAASQLSTTRLEAGRQAQITATFPCRIQYPGTLFFELQYQPAGTGETVTYEIDFKTYERVK